MKPVFLLSLVALLAGCHRPTVPARPKTAVKVASVARAQATAGHRYSAHVDPAVRVDLAFKVGGYVDTLAKKPGVDGQLRALQEGDLVRAGEVLATLRVTDYALRVQEARAAYEQAKTAADQAQRDVDRLQKLLSGGASTKVDLDAATARLDATRATLAGAKTKVDQAATMLSDATLRAPMNGVVLKRHVEVGSLAGAGTLAFSLADVSSVKAVFAVPDAVLPSLQLGAKQAVTTEAWPGESFAGRLSRVSPAADPRSLVFEAEVLVPNDDGRLKPGMVAALSLDAKLAADAPLVPLSAIVRAQDHGFAVFVVDDASVAHLRTIELGEYLGRVIPVKKGLAGGERIVVLGAGLLSNDEPVEVIP